MKKIGLIFWFSLLSIVSVIAQSGYDDYIPLNSNLGFEPEETAIIRDPQEIKARLKKAKMDYYGNTDQYILVKLYAKAKGCTQPYHEINIDKGNNQATIEFKLLERGLCDKDQSLSNTILIAKFAYENDEIILTTPIERTTTY